MTDKFFPDDFSLVATPDGSKAVMLDGGDYTTVEGIGARLALSGNLAPAATWNPSTGDVQFGGNNTTPVAPTIDGGLTNAGLLAVAVATAPGGKVIAIGADDAPANTSAIWPLDGEITGPFEISYFTQMTPTAAEWFAGVVFLGDFDTETLFSYTTGYDSTDTPKVIIGRGDAPGGINVLSTTGGFGAQQCAFVRIRVDWTKAASAPPAIFVQHEVVNFDGARIEGGFGNGSMASFSSAWDGSTCTRVGVILSTGTTGAVTPGSAVISGLTVTRLPRGV